MATYDSHERVIATLDKLLYIERLDHAPAPIACRIQREHDPDATPQSVRGCHAHEGQAALTVARMRSNMAPAAVYRSVRHREGHTAHHTYEETHVARNTLRTWPIA